MTSTHPPYPSLPSTIILTSTKSYFSPQRTLEYLSSHLEPSNGILPIPDQNILFALIPDFLSIYPCQHLLNQLFQSQSSWPLLLGAQDCFAPPNSGSVFTPDTYGPYTGFILPSALSTLGVRIVELGHAERRRFVGEHDEIVANKAAAVCACGMIPLICIGELEKPNLSGPMSASIGTATRQLTPQITSLLAAVPADAPVIFAYEPVWAIGASQPAGVEYVGPVVQAIREVIKSTARTGQTRVVYGGSAGPGLWSGATNGGNGLGKFVDGMFLGRFAHEIGGVKKVVDEVLESISSRA